MKPFDCDVLVIGAGPAGSTAATVARQHGLSVIVAERAQFPRFRIGESLLPHGNRLLHEIGVWEKVENAGFIRKYGAFFYLANGCAEKEVIFSRGVVPGLTYTLQVERAKFDRLLLDHARERGAEVRHGVTVKSIAQIPHGHRAEIESAAGSAEIAARWVVDATGRDSFCLNPLKKALDPSPFPKRIAIYSHFRGVPRAAGTAAGHTVIVRLADGWFWLIPIDEERTSVGLVTTVEAMRRSRAEPAELFRSAVEESPKLRELMAGAEPTMEFHVTSDYSYFRRDLAGERMLLAGDAGGFFDPIFSSGVYMAVYSAKLAVDLIARAHAENRVLSAREQRSYTKTVKAHAGVFQKLIAAFYDNDSFAVFMCPHAPLHLDRGVNSIVAGHAKLTWPIWWRFHLFLLTCRLQKRFSVVPRIDFRDMPQPKRAVRRERTSPRENANQRTRL